MVDHGRLLEDGLKVKAEDGCGIHVIDDHVSLGHKCYIFCHADVFWDRRTGRDHLYKAVARD